eukprot:1753846-Prymnesium_polylepis.1
MSHGRAARGRPSCTFWSVSRVRRGASPNVGVAWAPLPATQGSASEKAGASRHSRPRSSCPLWAGGVGGTSWLAAPLGRWLAAPL